MSCRVHFPKDPRLCVCRIARYMYPMGTYTCQMGKEVEMEAVKCRLAASLPGTNPGYRHSNTVLNPMDLTGIIGEHIPIQTKQNTFPGQTYGACAKKKTSCSYRHWMSSYQHAGFNAEIASTETRMSTNSGLSHKNDSLFFFAISP